jgi:4-hydroxy-4-methyl-2-oxoglutarate aldolase
VKRTSCHHVLKTGWYLLHFKRERQCILENKERASVLIERARNLSAASLHEAAGKQGALPAAIKPLSPAFRLCGWAFPVKSPPGDNLWLHRAIYEAAAGDVLVVHTGGFTEAGYWGEIMTQAAIERKHAGLVIDGGVRDSQRLIALAFPVFSRGICIQGTSKDPSGKGTLRAPIQLGDIVIRYGDLVVGDADGVVIIAQESAADVIEKAHARDAAEAVILERLSRGERTLDIYNLPLTLPKD